MRGNSGFRTFWSLREFYFFATENGAIIDVQTVPNPGHKPGFLPNFLGDNGAEVIIAGGIGAAAVQIFNTRNIEVITGARGDARTAVEAYMKGELVSTGELCRHDHGDHHHH